MPHISIEFLALGVSALASSIILLRAAYDAALVRVARRGAARKPR